MLAQLLLELLRTITIATGPRLRSILVPAIPARVRIFHTEQIEIFLPIRAFLRERLVGKGAPAPVEDFKRHGADFVVAPGLEELVALLRAEYASLLAAL